MSTFNNLDQILHTSERARPVDVGTDGRVPVRLYGPDGQPLFTEQNPAHVTLTGQSALVRIGETEHPVAYAIDPEGRAVPGYYNAAPHGYDEANDEYRIRGFVDFERPRTDTITDTLLDAVTIPPGGRSERTVVGVTNEAEIWFLVNIDQQPWSLRANPPYADLVSAETIYPVLDNVPAARVNMGQPMAGLYVGLRHVSSLGDLAPESAVEARALALRPARGLAFELRNDSQNPATATVRVLRVMAK